MRPNPGKLREFQKEAAARGNRWKRGVGRAFSASFPPLDENGPHLPGKRRDQGDALRSYVDARSSPTIHGLEVDTSRRSPSV